MVEKRREGVWEGLLSLSYKEIDRFSWIEFRNLIQKRTIQSDVRYHRFQRKQTKIFKDISRPCGERETERES